MNPQKIVPLYFKQKRKAEKEIMSDVKGTVTYKITIILYVGDPCM